MNYKYLFLVLAAALMVSCSSNSTSSHSSESSEHAHKHEHEHEHKHKHEHEHVHSGATVLSVEKANKFGVKTESITPSEFNKIIKVSGEILPAQGDSYTVSAPSSGTVKFISNISEGVQVRAGQQICAISGDNIVGGDSNANARISYNTAKRELERLTPLFKDKIVTEREYNAAKEAFEKAELAYRPTTSNNICGTTSISGVVVSLLVKDGEYVNAGNPIAVINKNSKMTLRADVPEKYFRDLNSIKTANVKTAYSNNAISLKELNGKVISSSNIAATTGYIPIYIEFDNKNTFASGSFAEVFLVGETKSNVLTVPVTAITEELGNHFLYVQLHEDMYDKRLVKLGESDGTRIEILSGLKANEKVVTEGVMFVRLASNSSEIPSACNHQH